MRVLRRGMRGPDVRRWQRVLVRRGFLRGRADGIFGPLTEAATIAFQRRYGLVADGIAGPATLGRAGLLAPPKPPAPVVTPPAPLAPPPAPVPPTPWPAVDAGPRVTVTAALLRQVMPGVGPARSVEYAPFLQRAMEEFAIDRPPRAAAFLAQLAHESGQLRFMEEIWGPTPAQRRYEPPTPLAARLGNAQPGDGKRFKGRGPIQLTGRANYRVFGDALGLDLVSNPPLAATKEVAFRIAGLYWRKRGLNALADQQDFRRITKLINGGFNGLVDRLRFWDQAKRIFDVRSLSAATARRMRQLVPPDEAPDLRFHRGLDDRGDVTPTAVERSAGALRSRARTAVAATRRAPKKKVGRPTAKKVTAPTPKPKAKAVKTRATARTAAGRRKKVARGKKRPVNTRRAKR